MKAAPWTAIVPKSRDFHVGHASVDSQQDRRQFGLTLRRNRVLNIG